MIRGNAVDIRRLVDLRAERSYCLDSMVVRKNEQYIWLRPLSVGCQSTGTGMPVRVKQPQQPAGMCACSFRSFRIHSPSPGLILRCLASGNGYITDFQACRWSNNQGSFNIGKFSDCGGLQVVSIFLPVPV